jgi:hypothetical protein
MTRLSVTAPTSSIDGVQRVFNRSSRECPPRDEAE